MNQKEYHRLELTVFETCPQDIVTTSDGSSSGGTGLEKYDVWDSDQTWTTY